MQHKKFQYKIQKHAHIFKYYAHETGIITAELFCMFLSTLYKQLIIKWNKKSRNYFQDFFIYNRLD